MEEQKETNYDAWLERQKAADEKAAAKEELFRARRAAELAEATHVPVSLYRLGHQQSTSRSTTRQLILDVTAILVTTTHYCLYKARLSHLIQSHREAQLIGKLQLITGTGMKKLAKQLN